MFINRGTGRPLDLCCKDALAARVQHLLKSGAYEATDMTGLMYQQVTLYAPTRLHELNRACFGVFLTDCPFWGIYDCFTCDNARCRRELEVILIDYVLIETIDQMARQLYDLTDNKMPNDLLLQKASASEKDRARRMLSSSRFSNPKRVAHYYSASSGPLP